MVKKRWESGFIRRGSLITLWSQNIPWKNVKFIFSAEIISIRKRYDEADDSVAVHLNHDTTERVRLHRILRPLACGGIEDALA